MTVKKRWKKTPYQRIVAAAHKGVGVRLSAEEVEKMGLLDEAIIQLALNDDEAEQEAKYRHKECK